MDCAKSLLQLRIKNSVRLIADLTISSSGNFVSPKRLTSVVNTNHQRIGIALSLLSRGLYPFFERELQVVYGARWETIARNSCRSQASLERTHFHWDAQAILTVMWDQWNTVFRKTLGIIDRSIVSELREFRNRWAHQTQFTEDDCYRVLDNVQRLLRACEDNDTAATIETQKLDLLREKLGRRVNEELSRARFNRARVVDVVVYSICALAIGSMMLIAWGDHHPKSTGFVVGFTLFSFVYLIYRRLEVSPPAYGVHECSKCGKVIYTEVCPYCDPAPMRSHNSQSEEKAQVNLLETVELNVARKR